MDNLFSIKFLFFYKVWMHPRVPGRIWAGQVGSKSENIQKKIRFLKILERNFPIFSKKMFFFYKMGALEVTFVYDIESKNVKKVLVFNGILKNSCKELSHFEKKKKIS